jgi:hypothetical protein
LGESARETNTDRGWTCYKCVAQENGHKEAHGFCLVNWLGEIRIETILGSDCAEMDEGEKSLIYGNGPVLLQDQARLTPERGPRTAVTTKKRLAIPKKTRDVK